MTTVDLSNKTAAWESEIVQMGLRLAGAGHTVGMTEAQILSFSASLASLGIEAQAGGTAFSRIFIDIDQAVSTGSKNLDLFAKTSGMNAKQFSKAWKEDAAGTVVAWLEGLKRMKEANSGVFYNTLPNFGKGMNDRRTIQAITNTVNAVGSGQKAATLRRRCRSARRHGATIPRSLNARRLSITPRVLKSRFSSSASTTSRSRSRSKLLPTVNRVVSNVGTELPTAVEASVKAFTELPGPMKEVLGVFASLILLVGPAKLLAGNVQLLAGALTTTLWAAAAANPVVAVAAIGALIAGYLVLSKAFDKINQAEIDASATAKT